MAESPEMVAIYGLLKVTGNKDADGNFVNRIEYVRSGEQFLEYRQGYRVIFLRLCR